jgi:hypothetical protein
MDAYASRSVIGSHTCPAPAAYEGIRTLSQARLSTDLVPDLMLHKAPLSERDENRVDHALAPAGGL